MRIHKRLRYSSPARSFISPFISPFTGRFVSPFTGTFVSPFTGTFIEDESFSSYSSPPSYVHLLLHSFSSSFIHFPFSHSHSFSSVIHGVDRPLSSRSRFSDDFGARKPSPSKVLAHGPREGHNRRPLPPRPRVLVRRYGWNEAPSQNSASGPQT